MAACVTCGCTASAGAPVHGIVAALAVDDLDAAMELGLLETAPCTSCTPGCMDALLLARDGRVRALAARERFRARNARLERRARARAAARMPPPAADSAVTPALPPAAAAALARAKAKAAGRRAQ